MLIGCLVLHQIFVVLLLLARREDRKDHSVAMAVFFLANMTTSLPDLFGFFHPEPPDQPLALFAMPPVMILGPAFFFYGRALVSPDPLRLQAREVSHLLPSFTALVIVCAMFWLNGGRLESATLFSAQGRFLSFNIAATLALLAIFLVVTSFYVGKTLRLLLRYRRTKFDYFASVEGRSLTWFEWMIGISAVIWGANIILILGEGSDTLQVPPAVQAAIEAAWVYTLSFMVLWQQAIFKPHRYRNQSGAEEKDADGSAPKYQRSALDEERGLRIAAKIERAMRDDQLYRKQGVTLRHLANHTHVPENYLSQALNEYIGKNFYEFINHWRIRDARILLQKQEISIIEVSEQVGFNSRSTFNAAFKKETGLSPSEYRTSARNGNA